jgi:hypothetical protein
MVCCVWLLAHAAPSLHVVSSLDQMQVMIGFAPFYEPVGQTPQLSEWVHCDCNINEDTVMVKYLLIFYFTYINFNADRVCHFRDLF